MRFGSVCSGIEAASVAWEPLGWKAAWLAEIEPFPSAVLKHHYPNVPNFGDMTALPSRIRSGEVEAPDLFCGGTPCQAFSVAGLRKSLDDARGNLSLTFCEIANAIDDVRRDGGKPASIVFWENVPGVLSTKDNAFGCFLGALSGSDSAIVPSGGRWTDAGVVAGPQRTVAWRTLDAQYFGLAQRRRRVFVVASARDGFDPATVLLEWEGLRRDSAPSREAGKESAASIGFSVTGSVTSGYGAKLGTDESCQGSVIPQPYTLAIRGRGDTHQLEYRQDGTANALLTPNGGRGGIGVGAIAQPLGVFQDSEFGVQQYDSAGTLRAGRIPEHQMVLQPAIAWDEELNASVEQAGTLLRGGQGGRHDGVLAFHPTQDPISSENICHSISSGNGQGCATAAVAHVQIMPTMTAGGPSESSHNQISGQMRDAYMVPTTAMQVRRLTPVECERLQGFPDGYTAIPWRNKPAAECPDGPRYKALGNSWAVPVVRWIGHRIAQGVA